MLEPLAFVLALNSAPITLQNQSVRLQLDMVDNEYIERYFVRSGKGWKQVLCSPNAPEIALKNSGRIGALQTERSGLYQSVPDFHFTYAKAGATQVVLESRGTEGVFTKTISMPKRGPVKVTLDARLAEPKEWVHSLLVSYAFTPDGKLLSKGGKPDSTFLPGLRPQDNNVVDDHFFRSPAAVAQQGPMAAILVPDVDVLSKNRPMHTILDLDAKNGVVDATLLSYGFCDNKLTAHVAFSTDLGMTDLIRQPLKLQMYLLLDGKAVPHGAYETASKFLWKTQGHKYFDKVLPQAMPFEEYAKVCYPAAFDEHYGDNKLGWFEETIDGKPCGGVYAGWGYDQGQVSWQCWFNNLRSAWGIHWWGNKLGNQDWVDKSNKMLNLALAAPMKEGACPTSYNGRTHQWTGSLIHPDAKCYYDLPSMAWKGIWMLRWLDFEDCPRRDEILAQCRSMAECMMLAQNSDGSIPSWLDKELKPVPVLDHSAQTSLPAWFMADLALVAQKKGLPGGEKLSVSALKADHFLMNQVVDGQYYYDFETFFSCSPKQCFQRDGKQGHEAMRDQHTLLPPQNTLCMEWTAEALLAGKKLKPAQDVSEFNRAALKALEMMNLYQNVWPISYRKTAYTYGGFGVQNSDGEYNDARQAQFGETLCDFGAAMGRQDLFERGVAATRAALTLINHPLHAQNGIYPNPNYPLGLEPENCCHGGWDHQAGRTGFDWGEGSGLTSMARLLDKYGQVYETKNWSVGIDGVVKKDGQWVSLLLSDFQQAPAGKNRIIELKGPRGGTTAEVSPQPRVIPQPFFQSGSGMLGLQFAGMNAFDGRVVWSNGKSVDLKFSPGEPNFWSIPAELSPVAFRVVGRSANSEINDGPFRVYVDPAFTFRDMSDWQVQGSFAESSTDSQREGFGLNPGEWFIGTCEDGRGGYDDAYTGMITSPRFYVHDGFVNLMVGGGAGKDVYVELIEADTGQQLAVAHGKNSERLEPVTWRVKIDRHHPAPLQIRVVDNETGGWGHINVARVRCGS